MSTQDIARNCLVSIKSLSDSDFYTPRYLTQAFSRISEELSNRGNLSGDLKRQLRQMV
jgi:hypothetical protein